MLIKYDKSMRIFLVCLIFLFHFFFIVLVRYRMITSNEARGDELAIYHV